MYEELKRLFDKKNLDEITQDEMKQNIGALTKIYEKIKELNRQNNLLKDKYNSDPKYARIHKRLVEKGTLSQKESVIFEALKSVKQDADLQVLQNTFAFPASSQIAHFCKYLRNFVRMLSY